MIGTLLIAAPTARMPTETAPKPAETAHAPPGAFPFSALVTAIRNRDLNGLRQRYGDEMFFATPPG